MVLCEPVPYFGQWVDQSQAVPYCHSGWFSLRLYRTVNIAWFFARLYRTVDSGCFSVRLYHTVDNGVFCVRL